MHIPPFDNQNKPIVDADDPTVPLNYFNIVKLKKGEAFEYAVPGYETCIVPATGTIDVNIEGFKADALGCRVEDVWDGEPEGVYVPTAAKAVMECKSDEAEVFVCGARYDKVLDAFAVRADELDMVQYGSDETKTHRKIKHILGTKYHDKVGRLLVSELFTVGEGGWSGFPSHKHDTDRLPQETRHDETYNFRFKPNHGSGVQMLQREDGKALRGSARIPDVLLHNPWWIVAAITGAVFSAIPCPSDRNDPGYQRYDRQVQIASLRLVT